MYVVSFIDSGKLVQVSIPTATVAATLAGYLPTCRVFKQNKLIRDITVLALIEECKRRYPKLDERILRVGLTTH